MKKLTLDQFNAQLDSSQLKQRQKKDLRFINSVSSLTDDDWRDSELLAIKDRSGNKGLLAIDVGNGLHLLPFEINKLSPSSSTGRSSSIICDFCMTWQAGTRAGSIVFPSISHNRSSNGFICCLDLDCSRHVLTKTSAAKVSRAQVRENLDNDARVVRLRKRLADLIDTLGSKPVGQ